MGCAPRKTQALVALAAAVVAAAGDLAVTGHSPCACAGAFGSGLAALQAEGPSGAADASMLQGRPLDLGCSCVDSARLKAGTPRDKLLSMGKVGLNHHLRKCQRELAGLSEEKEYAEASSGAQIEKGGKNVKEMEDQLAAVRQSLAKERKSTSAEAAGLKEKISGLTSLASDLKGSYNEAFGEWYMLKSQVARKVSAMEACDCKKQSFMMLSRRQQRQTQRTAEQRDEGQQEQESQDIRDTLRKAEQCETDARAVYEEITAAKAAARHAATEDVGKINGLKRSIFDQQRLNKIMSKDSQLDGLEKIYKTMSASVEDQKAHLEGFQKTKEQLATRLKSLKAEMKKCGC